MKTKADSLFYATNFTGNEDFFELCNSTIPTIASTASLLYILNPAHRKTYVSKMEQDLSRAWAIVHTTRDTMTDGHGSSVPPAHAAFYTLLAMDIMYDDLAPSVRKEIESHCAFIADRHLPKWNASEYSIKAMMELYLHGKTSEFVRLKNLYRAHILSLTSPDGVYTTGPGYAFSRLYMDQRIQKKIFMDVCEYQGYHEFYSDSVFQNLYEWTFGYIHTPFNRSYTFGDTPPRKTFQEWSVAALRVGRFSQEAQTSIAWFLGDYSEKSVKGDLLHFLLCDSLPAAAKAPESRIFPNGGAWLIQHSPSPHALAGAMWNITTTKESHNHKDINAIHIAAYGEHILRNSGYNEWQGPDPERWKYLHETSESSNTISIDDINHVSTQGAGITASWLGQNLAWASGSSGNALPNGHHNRNFFLVQPDPETNGYFALIDEVKTNEPHREVNIALHPNSAADPVIHPSQNAFTWPVEGCNYSGRPVKVTLSLGTKPLRAEIRTGYMGSVSAYQFPYTEANTKACGEYEGKYLYATYPSNEQGNAAIISIIFPYDSAHAPAQVENCNISSGSMIKVAHTNQWADYFIAAPDGEKIIWKSYIFQGNWAVFRQSAQYIPFWMANEAKLFQAGEYGFESSQPISIFLENDRLKITSPGTEVRLFYPGKFQIFTSNGALLATTPEGGGIKFYVEKGENMFRIATTEP